MKQKRPRASTFGCGPALIVIDGVAIIGREAIRCGLLAWERWASRRSRCWAVARRCRVLSATPIIGRPARHPARLSRRRSRLSPKSPGRKCLVHRPRLKPRRRAAARLLAGGRRLSVPYLNQERRAWWRLRTRGLDMADPITLATVATTDALIMARSESVWGSALASAAGTAIAGAVSPVAMPDRGMAPTTVKSLSVRHHILANDAPRRTLQSAINGSG